MSTYDYDVLIIGAGMSGLAAGIRLAYYDQRVCMLERHTTIGGLNSFYRLGGRNFDVGLHAVTNYSPRGTKRGPLARVLRQLRLSWDDFALAPQVGSRIEFPGARLDFSNDLQLLEAEIRRAFPRQVEGFRRLLTAIVDYDDLTVEHAGQSAREMLAAHLTDPMLREMLLCPLMFYGCAREHDMDFGQFCVMFRSIYLEGLARPFAGVRLILKTLVRRFKSLGGELRLHSGVSLLDTQDGRVAEVVLDDGTRMTARNVLSSAGWLETMRMCSDTSQADGGSSARLSFLESISILDRPPKSLDHPWTMVFFNDSDTFHWQQPEGLVDVRSGVICSPNNFVYDTPLAEGSVRITCLANYDAWHGLTEPDYRLAKLRTYDELVASAVRFMPDFRSSVIATDTFTPTTIRRFTGHEGGAVYGCAEKQLDGRTHLANLFVCGTDQGYVGIIGAIISGITISNRHLLQVK